MAQRGFRNDPAALDAAALIQAHDGRATNVASAAIDRYVRAGDVDAALQMDQVRRATERMLSTARVAAG